MPHECPFCGGRVSSGPEDSEVEDGHKITEVWFCPSCHQRFQAEYEFTEYLDSDGDPIPEREGAE